MPRLRYLHEYLEFYKIIVDEQYKTLDVYNSRVFAFLSFAGISSPVIGVIIGIFNAIDKIDLKFSLLGFALGLLISIFILSHAKAAITRHYRGWLEIVTIRAKIEQELNLTHFTSNPVKNFPTKKYWIGEPIIPTKQIRKRHDPTEHYSKENDLKGSKDSDSKGSVLNNIREFLRILRNYFQTEKCYLENIDYPTESEEFIQEILNSKENINKHFLGIFSTIQYIYTFFLVVIIFIIIVLFFNIPLYS